MGFWEILPLILIAAAGVFVDIMYIRSEYAENMKRAVWLKGTASLFFVVLGVVCFIMGGTEGAMLILIGLALGMIGDILLNVRYLVPAGTSNKVFAVGILAFLSGHFLYIAYLWKLTGEKIYITLIITAVLAIISIPPLMKRITAPSAGLKIFGYVYLVIVIMMFSSSVNMLIVKGVSARNIVFLIGALFFVVSDFIMIYYSFGKKIKPLRAINLLTYYFGQLLIALCVMLA